MTEIADKLYFGSMQRIAESFSSLSLRTLAAKQTTFTTYNGDKFNLMEALLLCFHCDFTRI